MSWKRRLYVTLFLLNFGKLLGSPGIELTSHIVIMPKNTLNLTEDSKFVEIEISQAFQMAADYQREYRMGSTANSVFEIKNKSLGQFGHKIRLKRKILFHRNWHRLRQIRLDYL